MGSAITFSGFNNVDFNLILNSLMQQASQPLTTLQNRQTALQSQVGTYGTLATRVSAMESAASDLGDLSAVDTFAAQSSDSSILTVATTGATSAGQYDVVVNELARAQVTASSSSAPDANTTAVASGGTLTIGGKDVVITGDVTLQQLADRINGTTDIGVRAAVIRASASSYRLTLTGTLPGEEHAFTVVNSLTGGVGVTFADQDNDGTTGDSPEDNAINATDARLLVNNVAITSSSNTITDVIPGVTITAYAKNPSTTVRVDVSADTAAVAAKLGTFVSAYNDIVKFLGDQRAASARGDAASIGRDPLLRQLSGSLRSLLTGAHGSDTFTRLSELGVEFTQAGTLKLDQTRLKAALASDENSVRGLVAGAFAGVSTLLHAYSDSSGFISAVKQHLTAQIKSMDAQIAQTQARLALQRESLQRSFIEADMAMSRLKSQSSSLANLGSGFGSL
ncbi:MAG: flagellar filament capping protein FliD [Vicinamibacterales bacterium]